MPTFQEKYLILVYLDNCRKCSIVPKLGLITIQAVLAWASCDCLLSGSTPKGVLTTDALST